METNQQISPAKAEFLARQRLRSSLESWCRECGFVPAAHHQLIIRELEAIVRGENDRLMLLCPPGSAKSTYTSKLFPPWFLAQRPNQTILACSHSGELATSFGRFSRNLVKANRRWLGYILDETSRAADEWATSNGGQFFCAGVGAGLSGRRADLGLIDDFVGKEEDVASKLFNDKVWEWYLNDFVTRLKPGAARVIIANHRNEDDLVGRLLQKEAAKWRLVRLRLLIENEEQAEQDPLGRKVGDHLWPEFFTKPQVTERMENPSASGIEQQEPSPAAGAWFTKEKLVGYEASKLEAIKTNHRCYGASDHAVRSNQRNDCSCLGVGWFSEGILYIHPDLVWDRIPTNKAVAEMLRFSKEYHPLYWWAERENISGSIGPFLKDQMLDTHNFMSVTEVAHKNKDLMARAQSAHALVELGLIQFPKFAPWWLRAEKELLQFPNGSHDDFVSFLAHIGKGIYQMTSPNKKEEQKKQEAPEGMNITPRLLKEQVKRNKNLEIARLRDR